MKGRRVRRKQNAEKMAVPPSKKAISGTSTEAVLLASCVGSAGFGGGVGMGVWPGGSVGARDVVVRRNEVAVAIIDVEGHVDSEDESMAL
jgi:hypothetical protein